MKCNIFFDNHQELLVSRGGANGAFTLAPSPGKVSKAQGAHRRVRLKLRNALRERIEEVLILADEVVHETPGLARANAGKFRKALDEFLDGRHVI